MMVNDNYLQIFTKGKKNVLEKLRDDEIFKFVKGCALRDVCDKQM